jgi:hypothetical protein
MKTIPGNATLIVVAANPVRQLKLVLEEGRVVADKRRA